VYVEETSFRAKSIEGVGTSTTAFVGPTRKGPIGGPLELLTSFGDFQRIYGDLSDLNLGGKVVPNYVAHAARAYFNEGGSRLYVSRVYVAPAPANGTAVSPALGNVRMISRLPGDAANGQGALRMLAAPVTRRTMDTAPVGSMARVSGTSQPSPAQLTGGTPPFGIADGGILRIEVNGAAAVDITFHGVAPEATGSAALNDPITFDATNNTMQVNLNGLQQQVQVAVGSIARATLVAAVNSQLSGGFARLDATNHLVIGSDRRGKAGSVTVNAAPGFGFASAVTVRGSDIATNNVNDRSAVTVQEIDTLVNTAAPGVHASISASNRLQLITVSTGSAATLTVRDAGANSAHTALGLTATPAGPTPGASGGTAGTAANYYTKTATGWVDQNNTALDLSNVQPGAAPGGGADLLTLNVQATDKDGGVITYEDMGFSPDHPRWIGFVMPQDPARRADALESLFAIQIQGPINPAVLRTALFPTGDTNTLTLTGGSDGNEPMQADYELALAEVAKMQDVSIVAAPGSSVFGDSHGIMNALIAHCEQRRAYRIAVLDTPPNQSLSDVRALRSQIDSTHAALYYPWVVVSNPLARAGMPSIPMEIKLPPSGFVCGIYARSDIQRGVWKSPANEVVLSALRFEQDINFAQQEVLNPLGVNCLRFFPGRGYRVWGARTVGSDPEWKYVSIRRYFNYLESSIDQGTQWAVFEPNGERLWANLTETISDFLYNEWVSGALLGSSAKEAFFVRCDRSTMTQNDLDNGRLICLVGVAALKPAEFVIFRIGQKTADARS
jgi:phage tail sheath protein FI